MKCILHIIRKRQTLSGCFFPHLVNFQFSFPETHFFFFFKAKVILLTTVPVLILEGKTTLIIELVLVYFRSYSSFLLFSLYSFSHFSYFALPYILFFYFFSVLPRFLNFLLFVFPNVLKFKRTSQKEITFSVELVDLISQTLSLFVYIKYSENQMLDQ